MTYAGSRKTLEQMLATYPNIDLFLSLTSRIIKAVGFEQLDLFNYNLFIFSIHTSSCIPDQLSDSFPTIKD